MLFSLRIPYLKTGLIPALLLAAACACQPASGQGPAGPQLSRDAQFREYWYSGTAELNRFRLEQARYGELHAGEAVLIFVTEPFLKSSQVKYEGNGADDLAKDAIGIFKLNATRKFFTGIYPYSTMTSTFTPVDAAGPSPLKITTGVQEWCGHVFAQLNLRDHQYQIKSHSYFQKEADEEFEIPGVATEDGLWSLIRLAPDRLPVGAVKLLPGTLFLRLRHLPTQAESAVTRFVAPDLKNFSGLRFSPAALRVYEIEYQSVPRTVRIVFEKDFPHAIVAFEETGESGWGASKKILTTRAVRTNVLRTNYWDKHSNADAPLRAQLGVSQP